MQVPVIRLGPVSVYLGEKSGKYPDGNQVVVRGADTLVAFDTPLVANRLGEELLAADLVVLGHVHEDHMAGLHRLPHAPVYVHEADAAAARSWDGLARHYGYAPAVLAGMHEKIKREFHYVPRPDALAYASGTRWDLGGGVTVRAIHAPGHTSGHCVLLVEPGGIAFIGDIDLSSFGPYYGDATSSLEAFRKTLAAVKDIPAKAWITSHHKGVITDRATFLELLAAFASRLDAREEAIAAFLRARPATLEELIAHRFVYPKQLNDLFYEDVERRTIAQHLESLAQAGRARRDGEVWTAR
ncbi:MAG TPA: MBL fold metallo-hydrolase [Burkholderiales bacterium]|jgi:glyoxylase-like metal-dependent hydrolase (beta-lactamase superfamily II)|nr:MBL fold metallo-hydrolase [Burkholderiales bacterium]